MRYLFSVLPEKTEVGQEDLWAPADEPVVPWFPATLNNVFLSIPSFKRSPYAIVADREINLNELAAKLVKEYPGLPENLHENYVLKTAEAAHHFPVGSRLFVVINPDSAFLRKVGDEETPYVLWKKQPFGEI